MAFSYILEELETSKLFQVRYLLGDTKPANNLMEDEEINFALGVSGNIYLAGARCAESLAARFARETTQRNANVTFDHGAKQSHFERLAKKLRNRKRRSIVTAKTNPPNDSKITRGKFSIGQFDNYRTGLGGSRVSGSRFKY